MKFAHDAAPPVARGRPVDILRRAIADLDPSYIEGERLLPERKLGEILGVGRRAVRIALDELESEGLIFRRQGQGTFVREVGSKSASFKALSSRTSPQDIIEVRLEIEPILSRLSAMRATPRDIDQMKHFLRRAAQSSAPRECEQWDSAFHSKIAESVRNSMFLGLFRLMNSVRQEQRWVNSRTRVFIPGVREEMISQHSAIIAAIENRMPEEAEAAMRTHILTAGRRNQLLTGR